MHVVNFCLNILSCRIISQTSDDVHLNSNCIQCYQYKPFMWQPNEHGFCAQMKAMYQQWQLCHVFSLPMTAVESTFFTDIDYKPCFDFRAIKMWTSHASPHDRNGGESSVKVAECKITIESPNVFFFKQAVK